MPPLNALRAFEVAARAGNFTEAAKQLNVSQGAISRQIALLELFLGAPLFERGHREVRLTAEGAEYALVVQSSFDRIEQATQARLQAHRHRPLRIKLFPTLAMKWLAPRLGEFHSLYPSIDIQLTTTLSYVHLETDEADITIQTRLEAAPGIHQELLFEIELMPVCSPAYLTKIQLIERPAQLLDHTLLHSMRWPDDWQIWFAAAGIKPREVRGGLTFGNSVLAYQAAMDGAGITMAHTQMIGDDIINGRLAAVSPLIAQSGDSYYLTFRKVDSERPDIKAFRTWIRDKVYSVGKLCP